MLNDVVQDTVLDLGGEVPPLQDVWLQSQSVMLEDELSSWSLLSALIVFLKAVMSTRVWRVGSCAYCSTEGPYSVSVVQRKASIEFQRLLLVFIIHCIFSLFSWIWAAELETLQLQVVNADKGTTGGLHEKLSMTVAMPLLWGVPPAVDALHHAIRSGGGIVEKVYRQWEFL